jgi:hypothetical protein
VDPVSFHLTGDLAGGYAKVGWEENPSSVPPARDGYSAPSTTTSVPSPKGVPRTHSPPSRA